MDLGRKDRHVDRRKRLFLVFFFIDTMSINCALVDTADGMLKEGHELNTLALWNKI